MEDRKTAPALRARLLRSYVPLRCVRTKVRPPALPHPFPTEISPPTNSKLNVVFSLLSCYHIHEAFTFLTVQITAASAVPNDYILICLSKEISMLYSLSYSAARFLRHAASCSIHLNKEAMKWKEKQTGFISHVSS